MNKTELVAKMAEKAGTSKKDTEVVLKAFIDSIGEALEGGDKVQLIGFGTFETRKREERKGRNPQTKEEIIIPSCITPAFKAGKELKERVNKAK